MLSVYYVINMLFVVLFGAVFLGCARGDLTTLIASNPLASKFQTSLGALDAGEQCRQDWYKLFPAGVTNLSTITRLGWQFLDAWGKPPAGILQLPLSVYMTGSYSECRELPNAHFCLAQGVNYSQTFDEVTYTPFVSWGLCLPNSCEELLVESVLNNFTDSFFPHVLSRVDVHCAETTEWSPGIYVVIAISCLLVTLAIAGTVADSCAPRPRSLSKPPSTTTSSIQGLEFDENTLLTGSLSGGGEAVPLLTHTEMPDSHRVTHPTLDALRAFSLSRNAPLLFNMSTRKQGIGCFEGMRTLSMLWVVCGHTFLWLLKQQPPNTGAMLALGQNMAFQLIINTQLAVDTFFFIR